MRKLQPGREMDALIADKVMGSVAEKVHILRACKAFPGYEHTGNYVCPEIPHYSTDMAAAWTVVEKIEPNTGPFILWQDEDGLFGCHFGDLSKAGYGEAPEAICRAALKVVDANG